MTSPETTSAWTGPSFTHGPNEGSLNAKIWQLPEGATLRLAPGIYEGSIALPRSIRIISEKIGSVTLVGNKSATVSVEGASKIELNRLVLRGSRRGHGATLQQYDGGRTTLNQCVLTKGQGRGLGGGAVDIQSGLMTLTRCRLTDHSAPQGGAVRVSGVARVDLRHCVVSQVKATGQGGGALMVHGGAHLEAVGCTFDQCSGQTGSVGLVDGGAQGNATLWLRACIVAAGVSDAPFSVRGQARVDIRSCVLPRKIVESSGPIVCEDVIIRALELEMTEGHPYSVKFPSLVKDLGQNVLGEDPVDIYGRSRDRLWVGAVA
ncbi:MAG TPA: hypothetical protein DCQ06_08080 [Myxococcales bacterium]|nr:hypothetical protein [Myxococcales bacterium]